MNGGDPLEAWAKTKGEHPAPGELISSAASSWTSCGRSSSASRSSRFRLASRSPLRRRPSSIAGRSPACGRPGPSRAKPTRAYYYLTDVDPSWPADRQDEYLRDYNYPTLWSISIHEVYPGHFLHYQHLRRVESKVRKSILFAPASFVEGWAHYCEQMMVEAGFGATGLPASSWASWPKRSSAWCASSSASSCTPRTCRSSRACACSARRRSWKKRARAREAERGTFDPTYLVYTVGKLMLLKLRQDYKPAAGQGVFAPNVSRHAARQRHGAILAAPAADARQR